MNFSCVLDQQTKFAESLPSVDLGLRHHWLLNEFYQEVSSLWFIARFGFSQCQNYFVFVLELHCSVSMPLYSKILTVAANCCRLWFSGPGCVQYDLRNLWNKILKDVNCSRCLIVLLNFFNSFYWTNLLLASLFMVTGFHCITTLHDSLRFSLSLLS